MNRALALGLLSACVALAGCSGLSKMSGKSSSVPIEDRSSSTVGTAAGGTGGTAGDGKGAAGTGTAGTTAVGSTAGGASAGAGGGGASGSPGQAGDAAQSAGSTGTQGKVGEAVQVETHALPGASTQGQALEGTGGSPLTQGGATVPDPRDTGNPVTDTRFKDPEHQLSKRKIYFAFDSFEIAEEFRALIEAHATYLRDHSSVRAILQGHTDERGSRDYNLALGQRRAESVKQAMSLMGVKEEQVEAVSLGEEKPAQEGHDEAAWQLNRRTEIYYQGE